MIAAIVELAFRAWKWLKGNLPVVLCAGSILMAGYIGWVGRGAWDQPRFDAAAAELRAAKADADAWKAAVASERASREGTERALVKASEEWAKSAESMRSESAATRAALTEKARVDVAAERARRDALLAKLPTLCSDKVIELWRRAEVVR